jgi:hypothetical protein
LLDESAERGFGWLGRDEPCGGREDQFIGMAWYRGYGIEIGMMACR